MCNTYILQYVFGGSECLGTQRNWLIPYVLDFYRYCGCTCFALNSIKRPPESTCKQIIEQFIVNNDNKWCLLTPARDPEDRHQKRKKFKEKPRGPEFPWLALSVGKVLQITIIINRFETSLQISLWQSVLQLENERNQMFAHCFPSQFLFLSAVDCVKFGDVSRNMSMEQRKLI